MHVDEPIEDLKSWMLYAQRDDSMQPNEKREELLRKFVEHYPLGELKELLHERYATKRRGDGSFMNWITCHSKPLFGGLFRAPTNVTFQQRPVEGMLRRFLECLRSHGDFCPEDVSQYFGEYVILAALHLYYPREFLPILSSAWLDKIIWAFSLERGSSLCEKARQVHRLYKDVCEERKIDALAFVRLLDVYLGMSNWGDKGFGEYLESIGYELKAADYSRRELRLLAWLQSKGEVSPLQYRKRFDNPEFQEAVRKYLEAHILSVGFEFHPRYTFGEVTKSWMEYLHRKEETRKKLLLKGFRVSKGSFRLVKSIAELVDTLKRYGKGHETYLHYTTLTGLLHIIGGVREIGGARMFRLTRGDDEHMNDQLEWKKLGDQARWRRTFLMCFQTDENECAAMWGLYGKPDNEAIRLRLTSDLLVSWIDRVNAGLESVYAYCETDKAYHKLGLHQFELSLADVLYGGNVSDISQEDVKKYVVGGYDFGVKPSLKSFERTNEITGFIKSIDWSYEKETRIVFRLMDGEFEFDPDTVKHVYIGCTTLPFDQIGYMMGPCVPEKLYEVYEQTLCARIKELSKTRIRKSVYTNNLKFK